MSQPKNTSGEWVCMWESRLTGKMGAGMPMNYENARAWASKGNREYPEIEHWPEPFPSRKAMATREAGEPGR